MHRFSFVCLIALSAASPAFASWADSLFEERQRDFGSVPRGPLLSHAFHVVNNTGYHVHIAGCRVSCGCTTAWPAQYDVAPGQATVIHAQMDTRRFSGPKTVTIYVTLDQPRFEEVLLSVTANSRDDVTVMPDMLTLGRVRRSTAPTATTTISLIGNSNWQITGVAAESNYIQPVCKMVRRDGFEVAYELNVRLRPDTPVGHWYSDVWLSTNNPSTPRVRVPLTVEIEPALTISPATAVLGDIKVGSDSQRKVIVRGGQPFRITKIKGTDPQIAVKDNTSEARPVHVLTITVHGNAAGEINRTFHVMTDVQGESDLEFTAQARIVP
jgi:Protein of unknown function (DUF1573)